MGRPPCACSSMSVQSQGLLLKLWLSMLSLDGFCSPRTLRSVTGVLASCDPSWSLRAKISVCLVLPVINLACVGHMKTSFQSVLSPLRMLLSLSHLEAFCAHPAMLFCSPVKESADNNHQVELHQTGEKPAFPCSHEWQGRRFVVH